MSFINSILNVFLGSKSKKDLKEVEGIVKQILTFEKEFSLLSHDELREKTNFFKNIIKDSRIPLLLQADKLEDSDVAINFMQFF